MRQNHYETLGVSSKASAQEIRTAFRRLALKHHPDRSSAADAAERFSRIADAYKTLADPEARREYDLLLALRTEQASRVATRVQVSAAAANQAPRTVVAADLTRLASLFSRGRFHEAEELAHAILETHPREAVAYAVLGDIARARGELNHAANMYAHAVQMDARNPLYSQRYEELLTRAAPGAAAARGSQASVAASATGMAVSTCACLYMALANEKPIFGGAGLIGSFTLGAIVMLFLTGVALGAAFGIGGVLDRFSSVSFSSQGRISPTVALAAIAIVSFWAAALLYGVLALNQRTTNVSIQRLIGATVGALILAVLAAFGSPVLHPGQVLLWGGNLIFVGGVLGWMTADAFRH